MSDGGSDSNSEETLGERVRRLRIEQGLSQRELTERALGISYAYLSRIESGSRMPSIFAIRAVAKALNVNAAYLETGQWEVCPHCGSPVGLRPKP